MEKYPMPKRFKASKGRISDVVKIWAYGFDAAGFPIDDERIELADASQLEFVRLHDSRDFDAADGVIIPQGIFEKLEIQRSMFGSKTDVWVDESLLLEREKQIFDLLRQGKWVCFLVGEIVDDVWKGMHTGQIHDTDLCKRLLNAFGVDRRRRYKLEVSPGVIIRDKEFASYVESCGAPITVFALPHAEPIERRVIVELTNNAVVGAEFDNQLFFLPFSPPNKLRSTAVSVAKMVALAVSAYRRNRSVEIPAWVDALRFKSEKSLYLEINALLEQLNRLESQLESWRDYKAILTTSGKPLEHKIVAILESFFEFHVDPTEEDQDEALIMDDGNTPIVFLETKSTQKGIGKEFIDRLSFHRKSHWPSISMPGVLFVNNDMSLAEVGMRLRTEVPADEIKHANELNITIVRTIDLLFLMRHLENDSRRRERFLDLIFSGGGWLKANLEGYELSQ
jgi:hypothetical protein